ncbi:hypothetical protein HP532_11560 [Pseudomonas sp. CrR25]|nr:hypothetical protein [Pseudomonas sp. CrR25]
MRISDYPQAAVLARVAVKPVRVATARADQNKKPAVTPRQANTGKQKDINMATTAPLYLDLYPKAIATSLTPRMGG